MKPLTEKDVEFEILCEPEDIPIAGNAMASGDQDADRETEQWIYEQLVRGNEWAWCCVTVVARWGELIGTDTLGTCSYLSELDFKRDAYYADMKKVALEDLNDQLLNSGIGHVEGI